MTFKGTPLGHPYAWVVIIYFSMVGGANLLIEPLVGYNTSPTLANFPDAILSVVGGFILVGAVLIATSFNYAKLTVTGRNMLELFGNFLFSSGWGAIAVFFAVTLPYSYFPITTAAAISLGAANRARIIIKNLITAERSAQHAVHEYHTSRN